MSRNLIIWTIFIIIAALAEGFILIENDNLDREQRILWNTYNTNVKTQQPSPAQIEIIFANGNKRLFQGNLQGKIYPLRMTLDSVAQTGRFSLSANQEKIENLAGVGGKGIWKIYRNNQWQAEKLEKLTIADGDIYSLRFEK